MENSDIQYYQGSEVLKFCTNPVLAQINESLHAIGMSLTEDSAHLRLAYYLTTDICSVRVIKRSNSATLILGCFKLGSNNFFEHDFHEQFLVKENRFRHLYNVLSKSKAK